LRRKVIADDIEAKNIFFHSVEIDEAQIESQDRIPLSELWKKFKKKANNQFSRE
jgi:hypothetical protein